MLLPRLFPVGLALGMVGFLGSVAHADDTPVSNWMNSIKLGAQIEGGVSFNPAGPKTNLGQAFTDHPNQAQLNQVLVTVAREIPKDASGWEVGFKLQGLYGSDARYTHLIGLLDDAVHARNQFDLVEANVALHVPVPTAGGLDVKAGVYATPLGYETIDPAASPFYSHSYIFTWGLPFKHTGVLATLHATEVVDLYAGIDTGTNTSFGTGGDNNSAAAFTTGFGLNLLGGDLTVLALTHIGPENASLRPGRPLGVADANHFNRYYNDAYATWKATDKLSFTTELSYARDDYAGAEAVGAAQYVAYALSETLTLNGRAEVFRDGKGFFVGAYPGNLDYINAERGRPNTAVGGPHATYGELTFGATYKPALPWPVSGLMIRPELRYDHGLAGPRPFNGGRDRGALTIASDFVLGF